MINRQLSRLLLCSILGSTTLISGCALVRKDSAPHQQRLNMADFPTGADIVPNPYNNIAGFSFQEHYFLPGFPVMAHPMTEWVLDHLYADRLHQIEQQQRSTLIFE